MAIEPQDLALRVGDTSIIYPAPGSITMSLGWEVYHLIVGEIVASGRLSSTVAKVTDLPTVDEILRSQAQGMLNHVREKHKAIPQIDDQSLFDADLILDGWKFDASGASHPILGDFAVTVPEAIVDRINAILGAVAPPPTWFWAESTTPGQLRVRCVAVSGASSYNVYDGMTLLGSTPQASWSTLAVPAGLYSVRMAAVVGGRVGVLSFPVSVEVEAIAQVASAATRTSSAKLIRPTRWDRFKAWVKKTFNDPLGVLPDD